MGRTERTYTISEACIALGLAPDGKTLRRWMHKSGIAASTSERDSRFRELTAAQMKGLASAHGRILASDDEVSLNTTRSPSVKALQLQIDRMRGDIEALQAQVQSLIQENLQPGATSFNYGSERHYIGSRAVWAHGDSSSAALNDVDVDALAETNAFRRPVRRTTRRTSSSISRSSLPEFPDYLVQLSDVAAMHGIPERTLRGASADGRLSAISGPWRARSSRGGYEVRLALDDEGLRQMHALYGNRPDFTYDPKNCSYCRTLQQHYSVLPPPSHAALIPMLEIPRHGSTSSQSADISDSRLIDTPVSVPGATGLDDLSES